MTCCNHDCYQGRNCPNRQQKSKVKSFKKPLHKRIAKWFNELRYRLRNYRYWRAKGFSPALAWKKADLTL